MSNKTKNCKKKCCCCCCKIKPPPKPNLCELLVSKYTIEPSVLQTISKNSPPLIVQYMFFKKIGDNDIISERCFYDGNGKLTSLYSFDVLLSYNYKLNCTYVVDYCSPCLDIGVDVTLLGQENIVTKSTGCPKSDTCPTDFSLVSGIKIIGGSIARSSILNTIEFSLAGGTGNNSIEYLFENSTLSISYKKIPFFLSTINSKIPDTFNVGAEQIILLSDNYRTPEINTKYLNKNNNNGFYYIDNNSFVSLGSYNVSYFIKGLFWFTILSDIVQNVEYTFTIYYKDIDNNQVVLGSGVVDHLSAGVSILIDTKINFVNNKIILYYSLKTNQTLDNPQIDGSIDHNFDFIVDNTGICNI
jgi:hypothetical protein